MPRIAGLDISYALLDLKQGIHLPQLDVRSGYTTTMGMASGYYLQSSLRCLILDRREQIDRAFATWASTSSCQIQSQA